MAKHVITWFHSPMALSVSLISFRFWGFMAPLTCIQSELLGPCSKTGLTTIVEKLYNRIREPTLEDT